VARSANSGQQIADQAGKQSAFILQAFTWGDNLPDGETAGVCSRTDTAQQCYDKLMYPTAADQLELRNDVLLNAHPKLILWWSFQGTYGQAENDTYSIYPTGAVAAQRWQGLAAAIQAPAPSPNGGIARAGHGQGHHRRAHRHRHHQRRHRHDRRHRHRRHQTVRLVVPRVLPY
jgi:hypothetical protein